MTDGKFSRAQKLISNRLFVDALAANAKYYTVACANDEGFCGLDKLHDHVHARKGVRQEEPV